MEKLVNDKYWRIQSEDKFNKIAFNYLYNKINEFEQDKLPKYKYNPRVNSIRNKIKKFKDIYESGDYNIEDVIKAGMRVVLEDVEDWGTISSSATTPLQEIVIRSILSVQYKCNYISICLIYNNINLNEDFIEDIMYIYSGLFRFNEWDDEHVNAVTNCIANRDKMNNNEALLNLYDKYRLKASTIPVKFNLNDYCGELSREFLDKYEKVTNITKLVSSEEITK